MNDNLSTKETPTTPSGEQVGSTALFCAPVFNPLEYGIKGEPLMVPAHHYNRMAGAISDILSACEGEGWSLEELRVCCAAHCRDEIESISQNAKDMPRR